MVGEGLIEPNVAQVDTQAPHPASERARRVGDGRHSRSFGDAFGHRADGQVAGVEVVFEARRP